MHKRIAFVAILVIAAGCASASSSGSGTPAGSSASPSNVSSPSASATSSPSASAETTPAPGGIGFEPSGSWSIAESTVDGLRVRVSPGLDAPPVLLPVADARVEYQLAAGDRVLRYALAGRKDGYAWWEIFATPPGFSDFTVHGYVADGAKRSDEWLVNVRDTCPDEPTVNQLAALAPSFRAACYDRFPLTFDAYAWTIPGEGYGGACGVGMGDGVRVAFLQCENINHNWVNASGNTDAIFLLHYNPEVLAAPDVIDIQGQHFRITGHFIDPASESCADPASSPDEQTVAYWDCATKFVVDQLEPLQE